MRKSIVIAALALIALFASGCAVYSQMTEQKPYQIRYDYRVRYEDTLWDIASKNVPENEDVREYIFNLKEINKGQDIINLRPGQVITLYKY